MTRLQELELQAGQLPEAERAALVTRLLATLPPVLADIDGGVAEARRRDAELDANPSAALSDQQFRAAIAASRNFKATNEFPFRGAALSYPAAGRGGLTLVLAEVPISAFNLASSSDNKTYNSDFSIVALIRDPSRQVVQKLSQHYSLNGPIENLAAAKKGDVLFYRETQLPPGKYVVELIAYDATTRKVNVSPSSLEISGADDSRPRLSSVAVLKRAERLSAEEQKRDQPLQFGELLVYPNLGERIDRSTKQLAFFFTAWAAKGATKPMQVTLEILQNKRQVGQTSAELPPADAQGQIKYASAFPLDKFQPGVFELKVTISDGKNNVSRSTQFTLGS